MSRVVYNVLGLVFFSLGAIGAFLPVLPTVPFLLLSSYFFSRGSKRFDAWFKSTKLYDTYLEGMMESHQMTLKRKLSILLPVSALLIFFFIILYHPVVRGIIVIAFVSKYLYFFFKIKTIK